MNAVEHFRHWLTTISAYRLLELKFYRLSVHPPGPWPRWSSEDIIMASEIDYRLNALIRAEVKRRFATDLTAA